MHCQVLPFVPVEVFGLEVLNLFQIMREVEKIQPESLCKTSLEAFKVVQRRSVAQEEVLEDASNFFFASKDST